MDNFSATMASAVHASRSSVYRASLVLSLLSTYKNTFSHEDVHIEIDTKDFTDLRHGHTGETGTRDGLFQSNS